VAGLSVAHAEAGALTAPGRERVEIECTYSQIIERALDAS